MLQHAQVDQDLGRHPLLLAEQPQQDVLGADVVVIEVAGLLHRIFDHLLGPRRLRELAHRDHVGAALDELLDLHPDLPQVDVEVFQHVGGDATALLDQTEEDVLGADVLMVEPLGLLVGQLHHLPGTVRKSLVHRCSFLEASTVCRGSHGTEEQTARQAAGSAKDNRVQTVRQTAVPILWRAPPAVFGPRSRAEKQPKNRFSRGSFRPRHAFPSRRGWWTLGPPAAG